jgi:anti-sigma factor RsiW
MRCLKKEEITRFLDGDLSGRETRRFEAHLQGCERCRAEFEDIKGAIDWVGQKLALLRPQELPSKAFTYPEKAVVRSRAGRKFQRVFQASVRLPVPAFALMLGIIVLLAVVLVWQNRQLTHLKSPLLTAQRQATIYLVGSDHIQTIKPKVDLDGFAPIRKPRIFVSREVVQ